MKKKWVMTKEAHYKCALETICSIALDYDGYRTAAGLKGLVDDLSALAANSIKLKPVYMTGDGEPAYRISK